MRAAMAAATAATPETRNISAAAPVTTGVVVGLPVGTVLLPQVAQGLDTVVRPPVG